MRFNIFKTKLEDETINYEGGPAFKLDPETELYQRVATCLVKEPKFYEDGNETVDAITSLVHTISKTNPEYVLKLAEYARNKLFLRSVPILLLGESVLNRETRQYVREYTPKIIMRADEMTEIVAYLQKKMGDFGDKRTMGMLPNCIKKGLEDSIVKFDEYQLQKHDSRTGVRIKHVINLVHPKPRDKEQSALWKRVLEDRLEVAKTWETYTLIHGSSKETWEYIITQMPIMAIIRNLRTLLDKKVDETTIRYVAGKLSSKTIILNSKQFPFRFYSAYKAIEKHESMYAKDLMSALETAIDISVANLPKLKGITALFADVSGSMDTAISGDSQVRRNEIACLMLSIADNICERSISAVFSDDVMRVNLNPRNGVLTNTKGLLQSNTYGSTYTHKCLDELNEKVDRVIIFTDEQNYSGSSYFGDGSLKTSLDGYRKRVNKDVYLYNINLAGYGTVSIPENERNTAMIAGWSERILEYINIFEEKKPIL